ncbi:ATP-dependent Clp protease ATP-binding subunit [bacterium]|nr:ATP-dependent Clp protease ATP-binding subunit [bacterium]
MPPKKNTTSKKTAPKKPLRDDKGTGESVNDELIEEEVQEEQPEQLVAAAEAGASDASTAGRSAGNNGGAIITDYEATIPIVIPPGARSPVDDIIEVLHREVIGQDRAIDAIARALLRSREGFRTPGRPISTMFFAGPTGVGKTETVRALAKALHNDWRAILKVDCSEYSEPHAIARLIGAPPGYIGSDLPAILAKENVEGVPNRLILFDEIEKAHFRLHNLLLQIMDEGRITLARRTKDEPGEVSFEDCIVIMTSNVGAGDIEKILRQNRIGFRNTDNIAEVRNDQQIYMAAKEAMKNVFSPEFRNRLTEFIVFRALDRPSLYRILRKLLNISAERFAGLGFKLQLSDEVRDWLVDRGMDSELGVRPLVRAVEKYIDTKVAELHAYGLIHEGDLLEARIQETGELASDGITPKSEIVFYRTPRSNEQGGKKRNLPKKNQRTEIILRY